MKTRIIRILTIGLLLAAAGPRTVAAPLPTRFKLMGGLAIPGGAMSDPSQRFQLRGAITPTAGTPQSGRFQLTSGALAFIRIVPMPGAPELKLILLPKGMIQLSWPSDSDGFVLQGCSDLGQGMWDPVSTPVRLLGDRQSVTLPAAGGMRAFRLMKGPLEPPVQ